MLKNNLKNFFLGFIFLLLNVFSFAEIPHSYVTENPNKEVQKVETFKQRDKTEMNLSVTKIKAKEVKDGNISYYTNSKLLKISLEKKLYNIEIDDKFLVSESGENIFSINRFKSKNSLKSNTKLCKINDNGTLKELSLDFENKPQEIFLTILDKNYNVKEVLKYKNIKEIKNKELKIYDTYLENELIPGKEYDYQFCQEWQGINKIKKSNHESLNNNLTGLYLSYKYQTLKVNGIVIPEINNEEDTNISFFRKELKINEELIIELMVSSSESNGKISILQYGLKKYPKYKEFDLDFELSYKEDNQIQAIHKYKTHFVHGKEKESFYSKIWGTVPPEEMSNEFFDRIPSNFLLKNFDSIHPNFGMESPDMVKYPPQIYLENDIQKFSINGVVISEIKGIKPNFQKIVTLDKDLIIEIRNGKLNSNAGSIILEWRFVKYPLNKDFTIVFNIESYIEEKNILRCHEYTFKAFKYRPNKIWNSKVIWEINENYNGAWIERDKSHADNNVSGDEDPWGMYYKGLKTIEANGTHFAWAEAGYTLLPLEGKISSLTINDKRIPNVDSGDFSGRITLGINFEIEYRVRKDNYPNIFTYRFVKFPKEDFKMILDLKGTDNNPHSQGDYQHIYENYYNFKNDILKGISTLNFAEYYLVNEFIQFTANPTIQNAQPLALDNSVKDVTLETTGKGLVAMQQGDKLTVDGHEVVIGAGGNIGPHKLTIGNVKYTYEVKNGKFRIALNEWGVLEPDRTIPIKIVRNENGNDKSLAEHNLTIKAPRRVEGTSNIKLNQDYDIRSIIKFNGISLKAPGRTELESTTAGVSLTSTAGQGIPFMKEGDRLEISDGLTTRSTYSTRGVKAFTIGANGTLGKQQVKLDNGELTVFVEGGKLRVKVDNYLSNSILNIKLNLIRGTNEIMDHTLEIKTPEAPFNIKKNGLLDFGNVTSGSKRTAETDIVLEMLKDVSDVKFSLKDPQPILENLDKSNNLKVNNITYLSENTEREYKVKLKGNLTIPEGTKSGLYTGSTILELQIK